MSAQDEVWGHSGPGIAQDSGKSLGHEPGVSLQFVPNSLGDTGQVIAFQSPCCEGIWYPSALRSLQL